METLWLPCKQEHSLQRNKTQTLSVTQQKVTEPLNHWVLGVLFFFFCSWTSSLLRHRTASLPFAPLSAFQEDCGLPLRRTTLAAVASLSPTSRLSSVGQFPLATVTVVTWAASQRGSRAESAGIMLHMIHHVALVRMSQESFHLRLGHHPALVCVAFLHCVL